MRKFSLLILLTVCLCTIALAQKTPKTGILVLAHGGKQNWNEEVAKVAALVDRELPTEVAFGMASRLTIQAAVDRLAARGAERIVAVPLFVSSHSSVITSTEYLLGLRPEAPSDLAIFAKMDHGGSGHGGGHGAHQTNAAYDGTAKIETRIPVTMTNGLNDHPIAADILLSRAEAISEKPASEVVVIVAHGPVAEETNRAWLADMGKLARMVDEKSDFKRVEYLTVRDDAPEPIRSRATAELRAVVERAKADKARVLIVPLLISYGGIEEGIRKRLEGLDYTMSPRALLPDERLAAWVLSSAKSPAVRRSISTSAQ